MTVKKLIEELKKFDDDTEVFIWNCEFDQKSFYIFLNYLRKEGELELSWTEE